MAQILRVAIRGENGGAALIAACPLAKLATRTLRPTKDGHCGLPSSKGALDNRPRISMQRIYVCAGVKNTTSFLEHRTPKIVQRTVDRNATQILTTLHMHSSILGAQDMATAQRTVGTQSKPTNPRAVMQRRCRQYSTEHTTKHPQNARHRGQFNANPRTIMQRRCRQYSTDNQASLEPKTWRQFNAPWARKSNRRIQ